MKSVKWLAVLCLLVALSGLHAGEGGVSVEKPWIFAVPPGAKDTAAFMVLRNAGDKPVRLIGAKSKIAGRLVPMITTRHDGKMGMKDVEFVEIPAGGRTVLAPGADHLMVYGLKAPLNDGQRVKIVLEFDSGQTLEIEAVVVRKAPK